MDTVLDKSWLNSLDTNDSSKIKNDFLVNSIQGLINKQLNTTNNKDLTIDSEDLNYNHHLSQSFLLPDIIPPYLILESKSYFTGAQKWIGHVTNISKNSFNAQLFDLNNPTTYEVGEFELGEIPQEDLELLSIGASFYWSVGQANVNGQVEKKSLIRFQRIQPWTSLDYDQATDNADKLFNELNWD